MRALLGANRDLTRWHYPVPLLGGYLVAQGPLHGPAALSTAIVSFVGGVLGTYLLVRLLVAVMGVVERRTSLWPTAVVSVPLYCTAGYIGLLSWAFSNWSRVSTGGYVWTADPAPAGVAFGLSVVGGPVLLLFSVGNWARLRSQRIATEQIEARE